MYYSIKYYRNNHILRKADEIEIKYFEKNERVIGFIQEWNEDQRIVLNITELEDPLSSLDIFKVAAAKHKITLKCSKDQPYYEFAEANIPFYFCEGANTIDEFVGQFNLGVSDILVKDELGFFLKSLHKTYAGQVLIRVQPNIVQSSSTFFVDSFKKFFIRPDDIEVYEPYIDVLEFAGGLEYQSVLYDIYRDARWQGPLNEVILDLNTDIDSMTIIPQFGLSRVNCQRKCAFNKCAICDHIKTAAKALQEKEIVIKKAKRKFENDELKNIRLSMQPKSKESGKDSEEISTTEIQ